MDKCVKNVLFLIFGITNRKNVNHVPKEKYLIQKHRHANHVEYNMIINHLQQTAISHARFQHHFIMDKNA
jgi:hypothetical protein